MTQVIVAGGGSIGERAARTLASAGHSVVVIDSDAVRAADLRARGFTVLEGSATSPSVLEAAGALHVGVLVAATDRDEVNLTIAVLARRHFEVGRVIAVVREDEHRWLFDSSWGVDVAISSGLAVATLVAAASEPAPMVRLVERLDERLVLIEATIADGSRARGRTIGELSLPGGDRVATVVRAGAVVEGDASLRLEAGDGLVIVAAAEDEPLIRRALSAEEQPRPSK
jgi:trk system potassium uptake protein